jgi:hypothetical protein
LGSSRDKEYGLVESKKVVIWVRITLVAIVVSLGLIGVFAPNVLS